MLNDEDVFGVALWLTVTAFILGWAILHGIDYPAPGVLRRYYIALIAGSIGVTYVATKIGAWKTALGALAVLYLSWRLHT